MVRAVENIGEAAKNVPTAVRRAHPEIPWRKLAGMRDVVVHEYFGVDVDVLWSTATVDVLELAEAIQRLLAVELEKDRLV